MTTEGSNTAIAPIIHIRAIDIRGQGWQSCKNLRARCRARLRSAKDVAQFAFGPFQNTFLLLRKGSAGAIDIEVEHRHG